MENPWFHKIIYKGVGFLDGKYGEIVFVHG
jgi:hypothetical protein